MQQPFSIPPVSVNYAGFWKRFAAYFIDYVVIAFAFGQVYFYIEVSLENQHSFRWLGDRDSVRVIASLVGFLVQWSYFAGMESSPLRATPGKLATGIYVTDMNGNRISFSKASGRYFGKIISGLIIGIGYIMAGFTEKKQALHDQMAGCLVISK